MSSEAFETITLEGILAPKNLYQALLKVEANKGSAGVDGMGTGELRKQGLRMNLFVN
jgi:RNA-directed DNA polymerase